MKNKFNKVLAYMCGATCGTLLYLYLQILDKHSSLFCSDKEKQV